MDTQIGQTPQTGDFSSGSKLPDRILIFIRALMRHKWRFYASLAAVVLVAGGMYIGLNPPWKSDKLANEGDSSTGQLSYNPVDSEYNGQIFGPGDGSQDDKSGNPSGGDAGDGSSNSNGSASGGNGNNSGGGTGSGSGGDGGSGGSGLPAAINPGDRDFGRIVRTTAPNGGVIVLPDGNYTVSDVSGFNPSNYVVVVAQNPLGAKVVRTSNTLGATDQYFNSSSKIIFVGIDFKDIMLAMNGVSDFYFWQTRHSFPINSHPDPTSTYCAYRQGPEAVNIRNSNRLGFYGSLVDGVGHDAFKLNGSSNLTLRGVRITDVNHGGLQQGRGNSSCGWDGDDNYHTDSIQIYPGGVSNLTVENSYLGRQTMLQVDGGGTSNTNLVFRNNMFYQEPNSSGCVAMNVRVKTSAQAGATQTMTMQNNDAWCHNQYEWIFVTQGTRDGALVVNGTPISSGTNHTNSFTTRHIATPNTNNTPHHAWRAANPHNNWPCYMDNVVPGFSQSIKSC